MALLTQPFAGLVQQFGGEWAFAHAGDVGLGDADYAGDLGRAHAGAGAGAAGGRVGRGDERVGAVIHIEHGGLSAFKQYGLAFVKRLVENQAGVGHVRLEAFAELQQLLGGLVHVDRTTVVELDQHLVLLVQTGLHLVVQMVGVEQVMHADADTVDLVRVGWADATAGGADLVLAKEAFSHLVEGAMVGRDDVCGLAHLEVGAIDAAGFQAVNLLEEHFRVHDHAVADHRGQVRVDNTGGQQVQGVRLIADHHAMARVVAAVEARDVIDLGADQIGSLAFTLVAPLSTNKNNSRHNTPPQHRLFRRTQTTVQPLPLPRHMQPPACPSYPRALTRPAPARRNNTRPTRCSDLGCLPLPRSATLVASLEPCRILCRSDTGRIHPVYPEPPPAYPGSP